MSETYERQRRESETKVLESLDAIRNDLSEVKQSTGEIHQVLFGPRGQEYLGVIPQTERRIQDLEKRFWAAAIGTIGALLGTAWQLLRRL